MAPGEHTEARAVGMGEEGDETGQEASRMSFLDHLEELRKRILYAVYAIVSGCIVPLIYQRAIYDWMTKYFHQVLQPTFKLIFTEAPGGFMLSLKLDVVAGFLIS